MGELSKSKKSADAEPAAVTVLSRPLSVGVPIIAHTIASASMVSGLSRSKLYQLFAEHKLTPRRAGGRTLVLAEDLENYVRNLPPAPIRQHGNVHRIEGDC